MRYSLHINQVKMIEWGLNLAQASVFSVLNEAHAWAKSAVFDGEVYYWFSRSKLIEELPGVTDKVDTISRHLITLERADLIKRKSVNQGGKSYLYVSLTEKAKSWNLVESQGGKIFPTDMEKNPKPSRKKIPTDMEKNPPNNITSNHITKDPIKNIMSDSDKSNICANSILAYLNLKTKKRFKPTKKNLSFINARLDEGYSPDDLKLVVDRKTLDWLNDRRWNEYLRPSTLFNSEKFESYLNASPKFSTDQTQTGDNRYDSTKNRKLSASERQFADAKELRERQSIQSQSGGVSEFQHCDERLVGDG